MKQHELLRKLCETHRGIFTVSVNFLEKKVVVTAKKTHWSKVYEYQVFMAKGLTYLHKEITDGFNTSRNVQK